MAIVITFSGLVGTGKSVCSKYVSSELTKQGFPVYYVRFRKLSLSSFFAKKKRLVGFQFKEKKTGEPAAGAPQRFTGFELRSPIAFLPFALYFLWKSYMFQILVKTRYRRDIVIADRYVYDHFAHFKLAEKGHPGIYRLFEKCLPRPNLPFILYADFETVRTARPNYCESYIRKTCKTIDI